MAEPKAQFVISIDLEMSWGAVHHGRPHDPKPYEQVREIVDRALFLMERYGISATWAVVGHLFLDRCDPSDGRSHPEVVRPEYEWLETDWYDLDPHSDVHKDPTWYGPDLVAAIKSCTATQEIGSHSFGHLIAGDPGCSPSAFESDLTAAKTASALADIEPRSYVYPRNSIAHLDVLVKHGFVAYRGPTPDHLAGKHRWQRWILRILDSAYPSISTRAQASSRGGIVDVPQTYLFDPGSRKAERLGTRLWTFLVKRRMRHAIANGSLFHMWFHPHNLAADQTRAFHAMESLFAEARGHIDRGQLENLTMGALADRIFDESI